MNLSIELDQEALRRLHDSLSPQLYTEALKLATSDLAQYTEGKAKEATPQVTGNARRSTISDVSGDTRAVLGHYPYLNWLDTGTDSRGRVMQTRPGGYQIRAAAMQAATAAAPQLLDKAGREIAARWGGK